MFFFSTIPKTVLKDLFLAKTELKLHVFFNKYLVDSMRINQY